jgi:hypothetical protein
MTIMDWIFSPWALAYGGGFAAIALWVWWSERDK